MNRKDRRAADSDSRRQPVALPIRIHEAGHAVARLLLSPAWGLEPDQAVSTIDIAPGYQAQSADKRALLISQAVCNGPMVCSSLNEAVSKKLGLSSGVAVDAKAVWEAFKTESSPDELGLSMRGRMLIAVMGAAAEARLTKQVYPMDLFQSYSCEEDLKDFIRDGLTLGLSTSDISAVSSLYLGHCCELVARPAVWNSITSIASRLNSSLSGKEVARLGWPSLAADPSVFASLLPTQGPAI